MTAIKGKEVCPTCTGEAAKPRYIGTEAQQSLCTDVFHGGRPWVTGVGMPEWIKLNNFGRVVNEFFGHHPYLVGSAARGKQWRDVDVRLILSDEEYAEWFGGPPTRPRCLNEKWNAACLAFAALGRDMTGLPIDFQIDQQSAVEHYTGPREPLILTDLASTHNEGSNEA